MYEHPSSAFLVIEVAKSSYLYDLAKLSTYAEANVNQFWILDINTNRLEIYSDPQGNEYKKKQIYYT
ncbi:MAG TPA: Uma2 family endonuclease [Leptospiraceae bacterium]|nr:Uma2 family endonuclease [Leptospiraceae bacterium]HMX33913.1 Uma2 family endonuclease [Leptospiraceae bacterium]HMY29556.1 Uma2 family endonuclease [Leptospiraceae bacterium]HMZ67572.1 Uma2 family endonuclease [Leptospiraceae bacterium]HNA06005.1 Uma2 family endonuclease [Leptospiraceae bacterium]